MTKLLITNVYSARNRGDAAIVLGMLRDLRARPTFRAAEIVIASCDPGFDAGRYRVPVIPSLRSLCARRVRGPLLPELVFTLVVLPACLVWALAARVARADLWLPAALRGVLRTYRDADLIVAAGGGYLYTTSAAKGNGVLLATVFSFLLGSLLGKPVVLYSQSIGPFATRPQAWLVRRALRRVQLVQVRERRSLALLEGWGLRAPVVLATDAAFLLEAEPCPDLPAGAEQALRVGVTVRRWFRTPSDQRRYEEVLAAFVDWLTGALKAQVVFVPQVTCALGDDDDRVVARRVVARLKNPDAAPVVEDELRPGEIKGLCGRMTYFVGTRMHSNIFALSMGVPVLAIGYLPKTSGLMDQLGLGEWALAIDSLELRVLQEAYGRLVARGPELREQLASMMPELARSVLHNGCGIEERYLRWCATKDAGRGRDRRDEAGA
jgi:colanic acid/amylovoran biosynthesis protein